MTTPLLIAIAALASAGAYWAFRPRSRVIEDPEITRIRATVAPQMHAACVRYRAKFLEIIKEPSVVDTEESLFNESVVWRRQFRANPTPENEDKCKSHFAILEQLHKDLEFNHPELVELYERVGNVREALFILENGTPEEVRKLMADAKAYEDSDS